MFKAFASDQKYRMYSFLAVYVCIFLVLAVLGYYEAGRAGLISRPGEMPEKFVTDLTYYDLPRMTVNLNNGGSGPQVRLDISLEVAKKDIAVVQGYQPHIVDKLNDLFEKLNSKEIQKSNNMAWLHQEMLKEVNESGSPAPVHDIFLRQMLIM